MRFTSNASRSVVAGRQFSGMSMIVVTPPAAAARVAEAKPSHSVRPGSFTCTCVSTRPGSEDLVVGQEHDLTAEVVADGGDQPVLDRDVTDALAGGQQRPTAEDPHSRTTVASMRPYGRSAAM